MKHSLSKLMILAAALCLLLGACSSPAESGTTAFDPETATQAVLDSGAFSVELTELHLRKFSGSNKILCGYITQKRTEFLSAFVFFIRRKNYLTVWITSRRVPSL